MPSTVDIPLRFADRTLDEYRAGTEPARKALSAARRLLNGEIESLVLIGQTGVGKTHLAAGVFNAIVSDQENRARLRVIATAEWQAELAALVEPDLPRHDPVQVAARVEWDQRAAEQREKRAEWDRIRSDHWDRQPKGTRTSSAEWEAWDAEIPGLEAKRKELGMVDIGSAPFVGPTPEARAEYSRLIAEWRTARDEIMARRPKSNHAPSPEWVNVADLILTMRLEMDRPTDDRDETLRAHRLRNHPALVVLDDLGREKSSDWTGEVIYGVVNARYEAMLPTLVTSNLTAAELAASPYWPAISRLAEHGELVEVTGPDHRLAR